MRDVAHGEHVSSRAMVMQQKTPRPVQFEMTEQTQPAVAVWIHQGKRHSEDCLSLAGCIPQTIYPLGNTLVQSKAG